MPRRNIKEGEKSAEKQGRVAHLNPSKRGNRLRREESWRARTLRSLIKTLSYLYNCLGRDLSKTDQRETAKTVWAVIWDARGQLIKEVR